MEVEEIIRSKIDRLDEIPNEYAKGILANQKAVYVELLDSLEKLSRDDNGFIKKTQRNLALVEDIISDLRKIFGESEYYNLTNAFISEFDKQATITDSYFNKVFGLVDVSSFNKKALENSKKQAFDLLAGNPTVTFNLYEPVKQILNNGVITGDSYVKTVQAIKQFVAGGTIKGIELEGKLYRYSKQISYDIYAFADRGYTNNIARDLDVQWYVYRGGLVEDSREFCKARNGKYFHVNEVKDWAKLKRWDGKIPATDENTIFIYAGGYRCNHSIMPTSEALVPESVIERNRKSGNID